MPLRRIYVSRGERGGVTIEFKVSSSWMRCRENRVRQSHAICYHSRRPLSMSHFLRTLDVLNLHHDNSPYQGVLPPDTLLTDTREMIYGGEGVGSRREACEASWGSIVIVVYAIRGLARSLDIAMVMLDRSFCGIKG